MKKSMKYSKVLLFLGLCIAFSSCTDYQNYNSSEGYITRENARAQLHLDEDAILQNRTDSAFVAHYLRRSNHPCAYLGVIEAWGNGYAGQSDLVEAAKKEAAKYGADFIVSESSWTDKELCYNMEIRRPQATFTTWYYTESRR